MSDSLKTAIFTMCDYEDLRAFLENNLKNTKDNFQIL